MLKRLLAALVPLCLVQVSTPVFAFGPNGHKTVGTIADSLLAGTNAGKQAQNILGSNLRTASVWADCAKGVNPTTFK